MKESLSSMPDLKAGMLKAGDPGRIWTHLMAGSGAGLISWIKILVNNKNTVVSRVAQPVK
jgi:hypothetical protein